MPDATFLDATELVINMGPQHPSTHGVLRVILKLDGEKLMDIEAPARAQAVRVVLTELNRIASHLLWLGTHALDIGAITPVFYCLREREEVLKIFEKYCGARLTTHAFRIGGLQYETYDGFEKEF